MLTTSFGQTALHLAVREVGRSPEVLSRPLNTPLFLTSSVGVPLQGHVDHVRRLLDACSKLNLDWASLKAVKPRRHADAMTHILHSAEAE